MWGVGTGRGLVLSGTAPGNVLARVIKKADQVV